MTQIRQLSLILSAVGPHQEIVIDESLAGVSIVSSGGLNKKKMGWLVSRTKKTMFKKRQFFQKKDKPSLLSCLNMFEHNKHLQTFKPSNHLFYRQVWAPLLHGQQPTFHSHPAPMSKTQRLNMTNRSIKPKKKSNFIKTRSKQINYPKTVAKINSAIPSTPSPPGKQTFHLQWNHAAIQLFWSYTGESQLDKVQWPKWFSWSSRW